MQWERRGGEDERKNIPQKYFVRNLLKEKKKGNEMLGARSKMQMAKKKSRPVWSVPVGMVWIQQEVVAKSRKYSR